jgi:hypothetical protein
MKNKLTLPLLGTSIIFFFVFWMMLIGILKVSVFYLVIIVLAGLISFLGSFYSTYLFKKVSPLWYLGIPNIGALAFVCFVFLTELPTNPQHYPLFGISLAILSISSMFFFISFPEDYRRITKFCAILSGGIAIYALYAIFLIIQSYYYPDLASWNSIESFLENYIFFLMPLIGVMYAVTAAWVYQKQ